MKIIVRDTTQLDVPSPCDDCETTYERCMAWQVRMGLRRGAARIVVERLLLDNDGRPPRNYQVPRLRWSRSVSAGRRGSRHSHTNAYLRSRLAAGGTEYHQFRLVINASAAECTAYDRACEKLAADLDYARIDLYNLDGKIYFGEITIYPDSGLAAFEPPEWDRRWGELWTLPHPSVNRQVACPQ